MDTKALRQKILDLAIRGKLVPQDPNDEPASVLLERIRVEKQKMVKEGKLLIMQIIYLIFVVIILIKFNLKAMDFFEY